MSSTGDNDNLGSSAKILPPDFVEEHAKYKANQDENKANEMSKIKSILEKDLIASAEMCNRF